MRANRVQFGIRSARLQSESEYSFGLATAGVQLTLIFLLATTS